MKMYNFSTSRSTPGTQSTPFSTRKQPARNRRDRGCQTIDFQKLVKMETEKVFEEERKKIQRQIKEAKKKIWCALCQSKGMSKIVIQCTLI